MKKSTNRLSRRTMLCASGAAVGLPFLEAMLRPGQSHAQGEIPPKFVAFFTPGGTLKDQQQTRRSDTDWDFQPMLAPLVPLKAKINIIDHLDMTVAYAPDAGNAHHHCRGMAGCLTGASLWNLGELADGPSIDQIIAKEILKTLPAPTRFPSLEFAAGWGTGIANNGSHSSNQLNMAGPQMPLAPETDPIKAFNRIFAGIMAPGAGAGGPAQVNASLQAFDAVARQYERVAAQVGYEDRIALEKHVTFVKEAREGAAAVVTGCTPPMLDATPGAYDILPATAAEIEMYKGNPTAQSDRNVKSGLLVPKIGDAMTDLLVASLNCGLTHVASMQWGDSEAKFMLNFLKDAAGNPLIDHHHGYQHDRGFQPASLEIIYKWYAERFARLLTKLDEIKIGGDTLLDHAMVLAVSELQKPDTHSREDASFMVAGGKALKVPQGRSLAPVNQPHNHLLLSLCKLYGFADAKVGNPKFCDGPLVGFI